MNKKEKSTNTFGVQCSEIGTNSSLTNLKRKAKSNSVERQEIETQTYDSYFVQKPILKNQSTCTEINSNNFIDLKKRTVASETLINNLNKNYCFLNDPFHNQNNQNDQNDQNNSTSINKNEFISQTTYQNEANSQDPLLSTIYVQTELDYENDLFMQNVMANENYNDLVDNYLQFNDIQTQTYWNMNMNDNFTQTDFSLDNIFDN